MKQSYSLTERPGHLRIYGNCYGLANPEAQAMLLRKQTSYSEVFEATLDFTPQRVGYEAGVTVWWTIYSHASIAVTCRELENGEIVKTIICRAPTAEANKVKVSV